MTDEFAKFEWEVYENEVGSAAGCTVIAVKSLELGSVSKSLVLSELTEWYPKVDRSQPQNELTSSSAL